MLRRILWLTGGILGLIVAVVVAAFVLYWDVMSERVAAWASDLSGRQVAFDELDVELALVPRVHVIGLRVANADWAESEDFLTAESVMVRVDLLSLLQGRVVLPDLHLSQPVLALAKNEEGDANWDFPGDGSSSDDGVALEIGELAIEAGSYSYDDPTQQLELEGEIATSSSSDNGGERVTGTAQGSFQGKSVSIDFAGGSLLSLRRDDEPYPLKIDAKIGRASIAVDGTLKRPLELAGVDVRLDLRGESLAELLPIFGIPVPETPPYDLQGRLTRRQDLWTLEDFSGAVGDSDLSGSLSIDRAPSPPMLTAELTSEHLDFDDLAGFIGAIPDAGQGETSSADQARAAEQEGADGRLLPDRTINLEALRAMDMEVSFSGRRVEAPKLPIDDIEAELRLKDARLVLDPLVFGVAGGKIAGQVAVDAQQDVPSADARLRFEELSLADFFRNSEFVQEMKGTIGGRLDVLGQGRSFAAVLASANGKVAVHMSEGTISGLILELAGLDISEALALYVTEDARVPLRCVVAGFSVTEGIMRAETLVLDTRDSTVLGGGTIDLEQERLDLRLEAEPKDFSLLALDAPVVIRGAFADPEVSIAEGAPIPLLELGDGEDRSCAGLVARVMGNKPSP